MNEKLIEKKLREGVKKLGGIALKFSSTSYTGMPDRIILMPGGHVCFVELKSTGKKPTVLQSKNIEMLRGLAFDARVIDNEGDLKILFSDLAFDQTLDDLKSLI